MDMSGQVKVAPKYAAQKLDKIRDFCLSNLESRNPKVDYLSGYEDACEHVLSIIAE